MNLKKEEKLNINGVSVLLQKLEKDKAQSKWKKGN